MNRLDAPVLAIGKTRMEDRAPAQYLRHLGKLLDWQAFMRGQPLRQRLDLRDVGRPDLRRGVPIKTVRHHDVFRTVAVYPCIYERDEQQRQAEHEQPATPCGKFERMCQS